MASLIRNGTILEDSWRRLEAQTWLQVREDGFVPDFPAHTDLIVPLNLWRLRREDLITREGRLGLVVDAWDEPQAFADALSHVELIAVRIAHFTDGRAYSLARLLRERFRYQRELRAIGDVLRDQLLYLWRCGFDAFVLKGSNQSRDALSAFAELSAHRPPHSRTHAARTGETGNIAAGMQIDTRTSVAVGGGAARDLPAG